METTIILLKSYIAHMTPADFIIIMVLCGTVTTAVVGIILMWLMGCNRDVIASLMKSHYNQLKEDHDCFASYLLPELKDTGEIVAIGDDDYAHTPHPDMDATNQQCSDCAFLQDDQYTESKVHCVYNFSGDPYKQACEEKFYNIHTQVGGRIAEAIYIINHPC